MKAETIREKVNSIVTDFTGAEEANVTESASLRDDLGADSLDIVEIVMNLESEFAIDINDVEGDNLKTVGDIYKLVAKKV